MKIKLLTACILCFILQQNMQAQKNFTVSGGDATGSSGSVSYSIGQLVYEEIIGTNQFSLIQGVQQPAEISIIAIEEESLKITSKVFIYPNPADDYIFLQFNDLSLCPCEAFLYDLNGKLINQIDINDPLTKISLNDIRTSLCFLKLIRKDGVTKVFKIINK